MITLVGFGSFLGGGWKNVLSSHKTAMEWAEERCKKWIRKD
jgi:hypothetical protein